MLQKFSKVYDFYIKNIESKEMKSYLEEYFWNNQMFFKRVARLARILEMNGPLVLIAFEFFWIKKLFIEEKVVTKKEYQSLIELLSTEYPKLKDLEIVELLKQLEGEEFDFKTEDSETVSIN